jgi:ceramide glucosyltransferase
MESPTSFQVILSLVCLVLYTIVCLVGFVGTFTIYTRYSKSRARREPILPASPPLPGVSILRPLKGLDTQLYECLESAFRQNYPSFEILLSVADELDPAVQVAQSLIKKYPNILAKLIIGSPPLEHPLTLCRSRRNRPKSQNK